MQWLCAAVLLCSLAVHAEAWSAARCKDEQCDADCRRTDLESIQTEVKMAEHGCHCYCLVKKGGKCEVDDECDYGLGCQTGDTSGLGTCKEACKVDNGGRKDHFFRKYFTCVINEHGRAEWKCIPYDCAEKTYGKGVCVYDPEAKSARIFGNDCLFVREVCKRESQDPNNQLQQARQTDCNNLIYPKAGPVSFLAGKS